MQRAMRERGMTAQTLAERVGVDPKTAGRWLSDGRRTPHPRHRRAVSEVLEVDEMELWPQVRAVVKTGPDREVIAVYPSHSAVPREVWRHLVADADREITLCGYAPYWLSWQVPDLAGLLRRKAAAG